jgi:hypothetical protein
VTGTWILLALAAVAGLIMLLSSRRRRKGPVDAGSVSHSWLAEQRLGRDQDSNR